MIAKSKHSLSPAELLFQSFLVFLLTGLLFNFVFDYARHHALITTGVEEFGENTWKHVHSVGDLTVSRRRVAEESHIHEFRFDYESSLPLRDIDNILRKPKTCSQWIAWSEGHEIFEGDKGEHFLTIGNHASHSISAQTFQSGHLNDNNLGKKILIARMQLDLPFLQLQKKREVNIQIDRVLQSPVDDKEQVVCFKFESFQDDAFFPPSRRYETADLTATICLSSEDDGDATTITLEAYLDPRCSRIPAFLVDSMVLRWGKKSIHNLVHQCNDNLGLESAVDFKRPLYNLFPIKH